MNRTDKKSTLAIAVFAVTGVVLLCAFRSAAVEAVYPVEKAKRTFADKVLTRLKGMWRASETAAENVRLKREVASLALARERYETIAAEALRLRRLLGYAQTLPGAWVAAEVLSSDGAAAQARRTLRVSKGSRDKVCVGDVVAVPDGLVGKVVDVSAHTAEVLLVSDGSLKVSCLVEGARGVLGILSGGTDAQLVLRHLSAGADPPPRARVVTSGRGGVFPAGLQVGTLLEVRGDVGSLGREGDVQPSVDFSRLTDVFILIGEGRDA